MSLSIESLSNVSKAVLLARLAHALTISARDTYDAELTACWNPRFCALTTNSCTGSAGV
jgi:hypothetical protein